MARLTPAQQRFAQRCLTEMDELEAALRDGDPQAQSTFIESLNCAIICGGPKFMALLCRAMIQVMEAAAAGDEELLATLCRTEEMETGE